MYIKAILFFVQRRLYQPYKQRVRPVGPALKLRMKLHADKEIILRQFNGFHNVFVGGSPADSHPGPFHFRAEGIVKFIAVAVALMNEFLFVAPFQKRAGFYLAGVTAKPHGAAFGNIVVLVGHKINDAMRGVIVKLAGIGALQAQNIPGEFNDRYLHPETNAKIWDIVFPREAGRRNFALNAAVPKAAGNKNAVRPGEDIRHILRRNTL
jgi:hypothetical protein